LVLLIITVVSRAIPYWAVAVCLNISYLISVVTASLAVIEATAYIPVPDRKSERHYLTDPKLFI
jgi:Na+/H+ antiporter NhaA